jgi:hypothetical protein
MTWLEAFAYSVFILVVVPLLTFLTITLIFGG